MTNEELVEVVRTALREVPDPETGISIVDMGLIYGIEANAETGAVEITITFTSPACPAGEAVTSGIERRLLRQEGVKTVDLTLTFRPRWSPDLITPEGRAQLGMDE
jgi:metal-sulfur cluster biosynthetic enzyme